VREEVQAQEQAEARGDDRPKVYLDCREDCFDDFLRTEITFVDYVRDRTDADVHVLVTTQETGAGGREYTLALFGQARFASMNESLRHVAEKDAPDERVRRGLAQVLKLGLMRYVLKTGMVPHITIGSSEPAGQTQARQGDDPWNSWVFSTRAEAEIEGEESRTEYWAKLSLSADRVTPQWKMSFALSGRNEERRFDVDGVDVVSTRVDRELAGHVVKSLGPRWSAGVFGGAWTNSFENTSRAFRLGPAVELSLFPYEEYTRRQLLVRYTIEGRRFSWDEETLFGFTAETRLRHELEIELDRRAPWGSLQGELELSQYLHDLSKYRVELNGEASLRVVQGLSVELHAEASRVLDRLSLPRRGATAEEVLLEQRQVASGYEYGAWFGITYTFGSIYNNVVNPRFGD
jgi:hypothetical protein